MEQDGIHIKALDSRPTPNPWIDFCFGCFTVLNRKRINGIIPIAEIKAIAEIHDVRDVSEFLDFIEILDKEFYDYQYRRQKEDSK